MSAALCARDLKPWLVPLKLAPVILVDLEEVDDTGPVPTEAALRKMAGTRTPER